MHGVISCIWTCLRTFIWVVYNLLNREVVKKVINIVVKLQITEQIFSAHNIQIACFDFRKEPAYSFGYPQRLLKAPDFPGPGEHDPNFKYVMKAKPAFSFGYPFRKVPGFQNPAPNTYCEKKVNSFLCTLKIFTHNFLIKMFIVCI